MEINQEGNEFFLQKNYAKAVRKYIRAIQLMENSRLRDENEEQKLSHVLMKSYHNIAQCYLKMGNYGKAISSAHKVLEKNPGHVKSMYVCAKSLRHCGDFVKARKFIMKALEQQPKSPDIAAELKHLTVAENKCKAAEEVMCKKMFKCNLK